MYKFTDTTKAGSSSDLPAEAMAWNGQYFEDLIEGYRTLSTTGREGLGTEVREAEIGLKPGTAYQGKRDMPRTIDVRFQILGVDSMELRNSLTQLDGYLCQENAQIIFLDDPECFYICNSTAIEDITEGQNAITGVIKLYCNDPYKYSVEEYVVKDVDGIITVNYKGTVEADCVLSSRMTGNNCYIGYVNDKGKMIQFGEPEDQVATDDEVLKQCDMTSDDGWEINQAETVSLGSNVMQGGNWKYGTNKVYSYKKSTTEDQHFATPDDYGTPIEPWSWVGVGRSIEITDTDDLENFTIDIGLNMSVTDAKTQANTQFVITDQDGDMLLGYQFLVQKNNMRCRIRKYIGRECVDEIDVSVQDGVGNLITEGRSPFSISKFGSEVRFRHSNTSVYDGSLYIDGFDGRCAKTLHIYCGALADSKLQIHPIARNEIRKVTFTKHNTPYYLVGTGLYKADDYLEIDTATGIPKLNGEEGYHSLVVGSQIEGFKLHKGENTINCAISDYALPVSHYATYREVYR